MLVSESLSCLAKLVQWTRSDPVAKFPSDNLAEVGEAKTTTIMGTRRAGSEERNYGPSYWRIFRGRAGYGTVGMLDIGM